MFRNISHLLAALFNDRSRFDREWREYRPPAGDKGIQGRWLGEWISEENGHRGELKCVLTKIATDKYNAHFYAVFAKMLRVCYSVQLHGGQAGEKVELEGEADLGRLAGGVYHYKGHATPSEFQCAYRCAYDHGAFQMKLYDPR